MLKEILGVLAGFSIIAVIAWTNGGALNSSTENPLHVSSATSQIKPHTRNNIRYEAKPERTEEKEQSTRTYSKTVRVEGGYGSRTTDTFRLSGSAKIASNASSRLYIFVYPDGDNVSYVSSSLSDGRNSETFLHGLKDGNYYIKVICTGTWSIRVYN